jgi:hypothetical protein
MNSNQTPNPEIETQKPEDNLQEQKYSFLEEPGVKEKIAQVKKKKFIKVTVLISIIFLLFILLPYVQKFYKDNFVKNVPIVDKAPVEVVETPEVISEKITQYKSDRLKITIEYPSDNLLIENEEKSPEGNIFSARIIHSPGIEASEDVTEYNFYEGYIVGISTFLTNNRNLEQITNVKRQNFVDTCPETATISKPADVTIDEVKGFYFVVSGCDYDTKITYVYIHDQFYEVTQIYKGDLGIIQKYRADTEEIVSTLNFYPVETGPRPETQTYKDTQNGFTFSYPYWDEKCCSIDGPINIKSTNFLNLGNQENGDIISFYIVVSGSEFLDFLETQRKTFIDDYIVVNKTLPQPVDKVIDVGNKKGFVLEGYSYKENTLTYVDLSKSSRNKTFLVISSLNKSGNAFEDIFQTILDSFVFE